MKKILYILIALLPFAVSAQLNLAQNPSFETLAGNIPAGWQVIRRGTFENTHFVEKKNVLDGKNAIGIENQNAATGKSLLIWGQAISEKVFNQIPAGTKMQFSVYLRAESSAAKAKIYFESVRAAKTFRVRKIISPGTWQKIELEFIKENMAYPAPNIYLQLEGTGRLLFDKVYFGKADEAEKNLPVNLNIAVNGDVEMLNKKGEPDNWYKITHFKGGRLALDRSFSYSGKHALLIQSSTQPGKALGWGYFIDGKVLKDVPPGSPFKVDFMLNTHGDPSTQVRCYVEFMAKKKYIGTTGKNFSVYNNWNKKTLYFKTPEEKPTHFWIYFMLKTPGKAHIDSVELKPYSGAEKPAAAVKENKDYCRLYGVPPQRTWIFPSKPEKLTLEYALSGRGLKVVLNEIDGKTIKNWNFDNLSGRGRKVLSLPPLGKGAYELIFSGKGLNDCEWFRIREKQTKGVWFDSANFMVFKGKRYFPVFIGHPGGGLDGLRVYSQAGINGISEYSVNGKQHALYLDAVCKQFDMFLFLKEDFGSKTSQKGEALKKYVKELADNVSLIDRFIGFQSDEAAWQKWPLESVRRHSKYCYKYAPDYLTWQCNAPRLTAKDGNPQGSFSSVRRYALAADVTGVDIYPVPEGKTSHNDLPNQTLSCVGDYTDLVTQAVWGNRPVWMVLQAMGWSEEGGNKLTADRPRPTKKQLRFMVWNAITHGATGICWYGNGAWNDHYSEWFREFAEVNLELRAASEVFMAGHALKRPQVPAKVGVLARKGILVFVNEDSKKAQTVNISGNWYISPAGKKLSPGKITLAPQEVVILTEKPLKLAPVKRFVPQKTVLNSKFGVQNFPALLKGKWVTHPDYLRGEQNTFSGECRFTLKSLPQKAFLAFAVDDEVKVSVNGRSFADTYRDHRVIFKKDIRKLLKKGNNVIRFEVTNYSGPTGLVYDLILDGKMISSGEDTLFSLDGGKSWKRAHVFGSQPVAPWGKPRLMIFDL